MSIAAVREALADLVGTACDVQAYAEVPGSIVSPSCVVYPPSIAYDSDLDDGWTLSVPVRLFIANSDDRESQRRLDEWSDPTLVPAAVAADRTLGGACQWAVVRSAEFGTENVSDVLNYFTVEFAVEVQMS